MAETSWGLAGVGLLGGGDAYGGRFYPPHTLALWIKTKKTAIRGKWHIVVREIQIFRFYYVLPLDHFSEPYRARSSELLYFSNQSFLATQVRQIYYALPISRF